MEIKRRTEILIETRREIIIHDSDASGQIVCPQCGEKMLAAKHAAAILPEGSTEKFSYVNDAEI